MAILKYSGLKAVAYAPTGTTAWVDLGQPLADSGGYKPEPQEVETAKGTTLYAGTKREFAVNIPDLTKYDGLETIMKADSEVDLKLTFLDDSTDTSLTVATVKVKKNIGLKAGARNSFEAKFTMFSV
jgi:hypothetical protein